MPAAASLRCLVALFVLSLLARVASAFVVAQPGYTDAYYYADVATRLAHGQGLTADFVWSPIELGTLPVVSHRFWVPLATALQAAGITLFGPLLGDFRGAQLAVIAVASLVPLATYACARALGATERTALVAGALVALGGVFAPAWVSLDGFAAAAVLGALFFIAYQRAAAGALRWGLLAGVLVGLLYLVRTEAALFGVALLALAIRPATRAAGIAGSLVALIIGGAWILRDVSVGMPNDLLARATLLVHYEDFFAVRSPTLDAYLAAFPDALSVKAGALVTNAITFVFAFAIILVVPLAIGIRAFWSRPVVRAWTSLAVLIYLVQSIVWTLHSTRGSYFHSLGAFVPFGVALAARGAERLLSIRDRQVASAWVWGTVVLVAVTSAGALAQWDASFNGGAAARIAALDAIPAGSFLAIDAAAWRWISGREVLVTPADGLDMAACFVSVPEPHVTSLVLEDAHFSAYTLLYQGGPRPPWLGAPIVRGSVKIFPVIDAPPCAIPLGR